MVHIQNSRSKSNENQGLDVIVPYHGQYSALRELIGSIFLRTRNIPFQITLVDDGSPNVDFFSTIAQMDAQIDGIRLPEQRGFGAALNEGISVTKKPWILFLNSDCVIQEMDWLLPLYKSLNENMKDKVGLVSATMNNGSSNKLVERDRHKRSTNFIVAEQPLPLICALCPRKLFDKVGMFKEYPYGWYEDEEFFYRMQRKGYKQAIVEESWVFHHGGLTTKALWECRPEIKQIMIEENQKKCLEDVRKILNN